MPKGQFKICRRHSCGNMYLTKMGSNPLDYNIVACILVIHGCLVVLRRLLMVLRVLVGLLLVVRKGVNTHVAVITTSLRVSHGS